MGRQSAHDGERVNATHARIDENIRPAREKERERWRAGSVVDFKGGMGGKKVGR